MGALNWHAAFEQLPVSCSTLQNVVHILGMMLVRWPGDFVANSCNCLTVKVCLPTLKHWPVVAGSKIKASSIVHMAWELVAILAGYRCMTHRPPGPIIGLQRYDKLLQDSSHRMYYDPLLTAWFALQVDPVLDHLAPGQ